MGQLKDMNESFEPEQMYPSGEKQTLLKKFDIPVQHFDFSYIEQCMNASELERILQVLRSGEEGYYPELIHKTEERLTKIKPNSRFLRRVTPVLSKKEIDTEISNEITLDLNNWLNDINKKNIELSQTRNITKSLPEIRQSKVNIEDKTTMPRKGGFTDYAAWDKYDADTEILKMDLEEEKLKKEAEKVKEKEKSRLVKFSEFSTEAEAFSAGQRENFKGNEYFCAGEYKEALDHYTNAITFFPKGASYANRANAHFKLKKYKEAISDFQDALKYEPNNSEYFVQLGRCFISSEMWSEALACAEMVITSDPNHSGAQELAEIVSNSCGEIVNLNKVRLQILDTENKSKKSILKMEPVIIPIPGPSNMVGPYYKVVYSQDKKVIEMETRIIHDFMEKVYIPTIDYCTKDDDGDCVVIHIKSTKRCDRRSSSDIDNNNKTRDNLENNNNEKNEMYNKGITCNNSSLEQSKTFEKVREKPQVAKKDEENEVINEKEISNISEKSCDNEDEHIDVINANEAKVTGGDELHLRTDRSSPENERIIFTNALQNVANNNDIGGGGEPYIENSYEINPINVNMPYPFIKAWQSVRRDDTYLGFADILRNLDVGRITEVIGNKIDATILSEILNCLFRHFMVADEVDAVYNILLNLCRLQRFGIVTMFLSIDDKRLVHNLLDFLKQHGKELPDNIQSQYV